MQQRDVLIIAIWGGAVTACYRGGSRIRRRQRGKHRGGVHTLVSVASISPCPTQGFEQFSSTPRKPSGAAQATVAFDAAQAQAKAGAEPETKPETRLAPTVTRHWLSQRSLPATIRTVRLSV